MSHLTDTDRLALLGHIGSWKRTSGRRLSDAAADFYAEVDAIVAREVAAAKAEALGDAAENVPTPDAAVTPTEAERRRCSVCAFYHRNGTGRSEDCTL